MQTLDRINILPTRETKNTTVGSNEELDLKVSHPEVMDGRKITLPLPDLKDLVSHPGKRLAILAGCNYANSGWDLQGCINDVVSMKQVLISNYWFKEADIVLLTDEPTSLMKPTGANIKDALNRMVDHGQKGDILFFHFSGHGTVIPTYRNSGWYMNEAIIGCDFNIITGLDFRQIVDRLHPRTTLTILSDSCNSGGLIDQEKEQIGPSTSPRKAKSAYFKRKFIPYESLVGHFNQITGLNTPNIGTLMTYHFSNQASSIFRLSEAEQNKILAQSAKRADRGILLSGCQSDESSEEEVNKGKPHGVFSYAVQTVLNEPLMRLASNKQVVMKVRELVAKQGYSQHPCLYCSDENVHAPFMYQLFLPLPTRSMPSDGQPICNNKLIKV